MKYLKYFENSEDNRKEVWEIDDQFFDLMDDDNYIRVMLKKVGMDDRNIDFFMNTYLPNLPSDGVKKGYYTFKRYMI